MKNITLELINSFEPCYNPEDIGFDDKMSITPIEFIDKFESKVKSKNDLLWILLRNEFLGDKDLRLFAVWCAREALKLVKNPDARLIEACNVAEKFANGEATDDDLCAAYYAAYYTSRYASYSPAYYAADSASRSTDDSTDDSASYSAAYSASYYASRSTAISAQIKELRKYFK